MSDSNPTTLGDVHTPLRRAVTDAIRDRIVEGTYPPASRLYEEGIAGDLGVSRNPVREALQVLAGEGFVEIEPRRGARVASIDARRAAEIFEVRAVLEGLVAELAARKRTDESMHELEMIIRDGQVAAETGELSRLPMLNTKFHAHLAAMSDNELLATMLSQLSDIIRWIYAERLEERVLNSWHEHAALCDAIAVGDEIGARRLAIEHVRSARIAFIGPDTILT
jgi:DNA-binding GntR family transcriptional regulator